MSRRASSACAMVTPSAYSRSPPTGSPRAMRVTRTPVGLSACWTYVAVTSPSIEGLVAMITSRTPDPFATRAMRWSTRSASGPTPSSRSEEHTSELQSQSNLVCRLLLEKKKQKILVQAVAQHLLVVHERCLQG